jgi:hypothetical protein
MFEANHPYMSERSDLVPLSDRFGPPLLEIVLVSPLDQRFAAAASHFSFSVA